MYNFVPLKSNKYNKRMVSYHDQKSMACLCLRLQCHMSRFLGRFPGCKTCRWSRRVGRSRMSSKVSLASCLFCSDPTIWVVSSCKNIRQQNLKTKRYGKVGGVVSTSLVTHTMFTRGYAYRKCAWLKKSCRALVQNMPIPRNVKVWTYFLPPVVE